MKYNNKWGSLVLIIRFIYFLNGLVVKLCLFIYFDKVEYYDVVVNKLGIGVKVIL